MSKRLSISLHDLPDPVWQGLIQDARIAAMLLPYLIADQFNGHVARHKSGALLALNDVRYKMRAMTEDRFNFGPSCAKGAGRRLTAKNWTDGLSGFEGFALFDAQNLKRNCAVVLALKEEVLEALQAGQSTSLSRRQAEIFGFVGKEVTPA